MLAAEVLVRHYANDVIQVASHPGEVCIKIVDTGAHGRVWHCVYMTPDEARGVAAAIEKAALEAQRSADP